MPPGDFKRATAVSVEFKVQGIGSDSGLEKVAKMGPDFER